MKKRLWLVASLLSLAVTVREVSAELTDQQRKFYERTVRETKQEISDLSAQIRREEAKWQPRLKELHNARAASQSMHDAASMRLRMHNDPVNGTPLSDSQKKFYEKVLRETKQEIADLTREIDAETADMNAHLAPLRASLKASKQMHDAACMRLGNPNDLCGH